jgi:hypothetical protein
LLNRSVLSTPLFCGKGVFETKLQASLVFKLTAIQPPREGRIWVATGKKLKYEPRKVLSGDEYMETQPHERIGGSMITVNEA